MKEKIFTLEAFEWKCPQCGFVPNVVHTCLYHDKDKQFMVYFFPSGEPENFETEMLPEGYTLRWTSNLNAFREKIYVLDEGLDDRAIEVLKAISASKLHHSGEVFENIMFDHIDKDGNYVFMLLRRGADGKHVATKMDDLYKKVMGDLDPKTPDPDFIEVGPQWAIDFLKK